MNILEFCNHAIALMLAVSLLASVYRIWKGPNELDRVVSLEYLSVICITFVVWYSWNYKEPIFIDIALAMAALGFIGTVTLSKWVATKELK